MVTAAADISVSFITRDKTYTVGGISFTMKKLDAVTNGRVGHRDESYNKPHTVSLSAYLIGETEVTQELWQAVMGNNPSRYSNNPDGSDVQGKRPVEQVNWYDAIAFCNKLSKACNLEPCYTVKDINFDTLTFDDIPTSRNADWDNAVCDWSKSGFRLPTEAEWEWAAKGGAEHEWAGTDNESVLKYYAWHEENSDNKTHEVKKKLPNGYGLYDMSGNVWEWCWDWIAILPSPLPPDYVGPASGSSRITRGGSWFQLAVFGARACRNSTEPFYRPSNLGLRLVSRP